jgi:hypothetical protein
MDKLMKFGSGAGYEGLKGLAQNVPGGIPIWNKLVGGVMGPDFKMDQSTSPASMANVKALGYGMFSPNPNEDEGVRYASRRMINPY